MADIWEINHEVCAINRRDLEKIENMQELYIYNTLTRQKELFEPIHLPNVGMYVCGPTVYGDPHLGHARSAITFDLVFRYLKHIGYKVRYVRNITDVGHLENDADEGEDKIAKKARLDQLEPMEVAYYYITRYHNAMGDLNVLRPSIEPLASGHIIEQIETIQEIIKNGYAYVSEGSVYFDVEKYNQDYNYGLLSHRNIDEMLETTRDLDGQQEKKRTIDFALWKKASPEHIMRWPSPWSDGFPGWHIECSSMSKKYLGSEFDIHGGGLDLLFPHHECEIAQNTATEKHQVVKYWMHNNMITVNGQKMGKSLGNSIMLEEFFNGSHPLLAQAYAPMTIRFFILQAHYRSTLDFSNEALQASEKGLSRILDAYARISKIVPSETSGVNVAELEKKCYDAMNDDMNSAVVISQLFEAATVINSAIGGTVKIDEANVGALKSLFDTFLFGVLGIVDANTSTGGSNIEAFSKAIDLLLDMRAEAKANKDWATSDKIRDELAKIGFEIKDGKDGAEWKLK